MDCGVLVKMDSWFREGGDEGPTIAAPWVASPELRSRSVSRSSSVLRGGSAGGCGSGNERGRMVDVDGLNAIVCEGDKG